MSDTGWSWMGKYVIGIVVALIIGAALGNLGLFKSATLGMPNLTAATLVQFVAHVTALMIFALLSRSLAIKLRAGGGQHHAAANITVAIMTLALMAAGYVVLSSFIDPFTARGVKQVINWIFIFGIAGSAAWVGWALYNGGDALMASLKHAFSGTPETKNTDTETHHSSK
ncbi:MAG: hypothetical protein HY273_00215 [Gammaproteobacteria bacterium]|nr:hypothetical protein [Gammaproteobacteria bacterium]